MSLNFSDLPPEHFASLLKDGIQHKLEATIKQTLLDSVMPMINELAKKAAEDVCRDAEVRIERSHNFSQPEVKISANVEFIQRTYVTPSR